MSTFTEFNGPQQGMTGPTLSQLTAMIEAYNKLSTQLQTHVEKEVSQVTDVHNVKAYVDTVRATIVSMYTAYVDEQISTINNIINSINEELNDKADEHSVSVQIQAINDRIDTLQELTNDFVTSEDFNEALNNVNSALAVVQESLDEFVAHWSIDQDDATFDGTLKADEVISKIKVLNGVDYVKWSEFQAPFAGTGGQEMGTQGAYVLGCLSEDWSEDSSAPIANKYKPARIYVKYTNSNPFDAIIDVAVVQKDDTFAGTLVAKVAKQAGTWEDLAFHIVEGTGSQGQDSVNKLYLCVSSKGLAVERADDNTVTVTSTIFRVAGENFCAVGQEGYVRPNGMLHGVSTVKIGTEASGITAIDKLKVGALSLSKLLDEDQEEFISIDKVETTEGGEVVTHKYMFIGNENYDSIVFEARPMLLTEDEHGEVQESPLITAHEASSIGVPIGGIIRWPVVGNPPQYYLDCNGSEVNASDYPELAEVITPVDNKITLPNEEYSIIHALPIRIDDATSASAEDVMSFDTLNRKIDEETTRAQTAEQSLADDISAEADRAEEVETGLQDAIDAVDTKADANATAITAEATRAQAAEQVNTTAINNEVVRATTAEQANATAISNEVARAAAAEQEITDDLEDVDAKADQNADDIADEITRATAAEQALNDRISSYHPSSSSTILP